MNTQQLLSTTKKPLVLIVLISVLFASGVAWFAFDYFKGLELYYKEEAAAAAAKMRVPEVAVVVPTADAAVGDIINKQAFASRSIPADLIYEDAIKASDFQFFNGQKLARAVQKGRPLRISDLLIPAVHDVAAVVPVGKRALTIGIDNLNSIAQTVRPGNLLDIFLVNRAPKLDEATPSEGLDQAMLFMQNMEVLAVGRDFSDPRLNKELKQNMVRPGDLQNSNANSYDTVTLLVTPAQAEKLIVGQKMGSYRVALRGRDDENPLDLAVLKASDFMPKLPKKRDEGIEFIVGGKGGGTNDLVSFQSVAAADLNAPPRMPSTAINPLSAKDLEKALMNMAASAITSSKGGGG